MKSKQQYRLEALARVKAVADRSKKRKGKTKLFSKLSAGSYLVRMIKQVRK